jgi:hypothetical protein
MPLLVSVILKGITNSGALWDWVHPIWGRAEYNRDTPIQRGSTVILICSRACIIAIMKKRVRAKEEMLVCILFFELLIESSDIYWSVFCEFNPEEQQLKIRTKRKAETGSLVREGQCRKERTDSGLKWIRFLQGMTQLSELHCSLL